MLRESLSRWIFLLRILKSVPSENSFYIVVKISNKIILFHFQEHWATALQTLDLTLDEVVHIGLSSQRPNWKDFHLTDHLKKMLRREK